MASSVDPTPTPWTAANWDRRRSSVQAGAWEVDPLSPLRLFYGLEATGRLTFGYVANERPGTLPLSSVIRVDRRHRGIDDKWTLVLTLLAAESEVVFRRLAEHVYARVMDSTTEAAGISAFEEAVSEWKRLFASPPRLSLGQLRGLFAELWVGFVIFRELLDDESILGSWNGPFMADQDYQFPEFMLEVKSIYQTSRAVQISSEYQLDGKNIYLAVATVLDESKPFDRSTTLPELISIIRARFRGKPSLVEIFEDALAELEIDLSDAFYEDTHLICEQVRIYEVNEVFPRIVPDMLQTGITGVTYKIQLKELVEFERNLNSIQIVNKTGGY